MDVCLHCTEKTISQSIKFRAEKNPVSWLLEANTPGGILIYILSDCIRMLRELWSGANVDESYFVGCWQGLV